jgi:hypothetical protein
MTEDEVMQVLRRIARSGKPTDRLRAAELIGKQLGMFRDKEPGGEVTLEDLVPAAGQGRGGGVRQGAPSLDGVQRLEAQHENFGKGSPGPGEYCYSCSLPPSGVWMCATK